jgi:dTDP-4-dehydrorhamnose 3,5-epimerase
MLIKESQIKDLLVITPNLYPDERGYFLENYNKRDFKPFLDQEFVQDNESMSQKNVLRGLHFQKPPFSQGKLVRVISGSVLDVAVDLRTKSETYGQNYTAVLSGANKKQLFIPEGFAHGFLVLENNTIFSYKCTHYYNRSAEQAILWNDKNLNIDWKINNPIISEKDKNAKKFTNFISPF